MFQATPKRISLVVVSLIALLMATGLLTSCGGLSSRSMKDAFAGSSSSSSVSASAEGASASSSSSTANASKTSSASSGALDASSASHAADSVKPPSIKLADRPAYNGKPSAEVHGNSPFFDAADAARGQFEDYAPLDSLKRCGSAFALVSRETMPTEERGSIGMIQPSGWQTARYDWVDGKYLFNRCHLIAYQLAGENDNERNLITGTRTLNTLGMQPYEDRVASYVNRTGNHVLYRVTPLYEGDDLVARGVLMEAQSVEDSGAGVRFCAWCYNVEPGVDIDYATGKSQAAANAPEIAAAVAAGGVAAASVGAPDGNEAAAEEPASNEAPAIEEEPAPEPEPQAVNTQTYVLNTNTHKFHYPHCSSVRDMAERKKQFIDANRDDIIASGYQPCQRCNP